MTAALAAAAPAPAAPMTGGAYATERPSVDAVVCRSACAGLDRVQAGSVVELDGEALHEAGQVVFMGRRGRRDDVTAPVSAATPTTVTVQVPPAARSGAVRVVNADGHRSLPSRRRLRIQRRARTARAPMIEARVGAKRVFVDGRRTASLSFFVGGDEPAGVQIALVRDTDDVTVATWSPGVLAPGTVQTVAWDGRTAGRPAPEGRYVFRVTASGSGAQAADAGPTALSAFLLLAHRFPVAGRHDFGQDAARFGSGRSGHSHQGQDVFARCGTPLVAARGGVVKHKATHERAGNYLVITGEGEGGLDYAYMHLRAPALVEKGDRVSTGQLVGHVGDTGDASGCHLHFEMWSAPGWYTGGDPVDPLPALLSWDRTS